MSIDFSNSDFDPQDIEEPLVTTSLTREDENEYSLRPKTLREYIGQEKAKGNLEAVSYTHLDVYKRQGVGIGPHAPLPLGGEVLKGGDEGAVLVKELLGVIAAQPGLQLF